MWWIGASVGDDLSVSVHRFPGKNRRPVLILDEATFDDILGELDELKRGIRG